jgi:hypothetical protein
MHRNLAKTSTRRTVLGQSSVKTGQRMPIRIGLLRCRGVQPAAAIFASRIGTTVEDVKSRYSLNR